MKLNTSFNVEDGRNARHSNEFHVISSLPSPMKGSAKSTKKVSKEVFSSKKQLYSSKNDKEGLNMVSSLPKFESSSFLTQEVLLYCLCSVVKFLALDSYKVIMI